MFERTVLVALLVFGIAPAAAQQPKPVPDCEPGFERRHYPHGSELNFHCRTRVIDCPDKPGHHWAIVPDQVSKTAQGVQFGYRCQYTGKER